MKPTNSQGIPENQGTTALPGASVDGGQTSSMGYRGKRFLLFEFKSFYPLGGWNDLYGSYDTLEEAKAQPQIGDHRHIVDLLTGETWEKWEPEDEWG